MPILLVAVAGLIIYGVGIPLFLLFVLTKNRRRLHDETHSKYHLTRYQLGSFYNSYEERWFYWEVIVMIEKMLLVGLLGVVQQYSPVQLFVGAIICSWYALIVLRVAPYDGHRKDWLAFLCTLSLSIMYISGLLVALDEKGLLVTRDSVSDVLLVVGSIPLVAYVLSVATTVRSKCGQKSPQAQDLRKQKLAAPASAVFPVNHFRQQIAHWGSTK